MKQLPVLIVFFVSFCTHIGFTAAQTQKPPLIPVAQSGPTALSHAKTIFCNVNVIGLGYDVTELEADVVRDLTRRCSQSNVRFVAVTGNEGGKKELDVKLQNKSRDFARWTLTIQATKDGRVVVMTSCSMVFPGFKPNEFLELLVHEYSQFNSGDPLKLAPDMVDAVMTDFVDRSGLKNR